MAAICVARSVSGDENVFCRPRILKSTTGWAERVQFQVDSAHDRVRMSCTYYSPDSGRYSLPQALHTANSFPRTRSSPTTRVCISNLPSSVVHRICGELSLLQIHFASLHCCTAVALFTHFYLLTLESSRTPYSVPIPTRGPLCWSPTSSSL